MYQSVHMHTIERFGDSFAQQYMQCYTLQKSHKQSDLCLGFVAIQ